VLATAKVKSYEDLKKAKAERAARETAKEAKVAENEVQRLRGRLRWLRKRGRRLRKRQSKLALARIHVVGSARALQMQMQMHQCHTTR